MADSDLKQLHDKWVNAPESAAFYPLALAYSDAGLHDAAVDVLQQGLRHHPAHARGLALLGSLQFERGESDEARDSLKRALEADASCSEALRAMVEIEIAEGNCERARSWLEQAEAQADIPDTAELREALERRSETVAPELPFVTETMVDLFLKQGMTEKAIAALQQLIQQNPEDSSLRQRLNNFVATRKSGPDDRSWDHESEHEMQLHAWLRAIEQLKLRR
jgi:tetratricopeptide (TPR) repeat protein